ncbi:hypothetical protein EII38_04530 [Streptococcus minor]|uniref:Uncharacterized protein n=1 Tax=Streptococcus minor TaxID=229549 RepID=A0A3P1VCZ7_9STRE|nr:hypothetical protein [Streptococcus minor]RRD31496.1 hypothetical protein EII38_04530 [Streptococcus minor]
MSKVEQIEQYLVQHIDKLDFIVDNVLFLLPDSYFYKPEIGKGDLLEMRQKLDDLKKKKNFPAFRGDKSIDYQHKKLLKQYNVALKNLSIRKRSELREELLLESDGLKVAGMISLIKQYNLLSKLRTYR